MRGRAWSCEEAARLVRLWEAGLTAQQCADDLGRSRGAICMQLRRAGTARDPAISQRNRREAYKQAKAREREWSPEEIEAPNDTWFVHALIREAHALGLVRVA